MSWDQDLIPKSVDEPQDYQATTESELYRPVTTEVIFCGLILFTYSLKFVALSFGFATIGVFLNTLIYTYVFLIHVKLTKQGFF